MMNARKPLIVALLLICFLLACVLTTAAQSNSGVGVYAFGSFGGGPFDAVNIGNLNVHFAIPILSKAGRGIPFEYSLVYDSLVWTPVQVGATKRWQPRVGWGWTGINEAITGYVSYTEVLNECNDYYGRLIYYNLYTFFYTDASGGSHSFDLSLASTQANSCRVRPPYSIGWGTATAKDGSGLTIQAGAGMAGPIHAYINTPDGTSLTPPVGRVGSTPTGITTAIDSNGNKISKTIQSNGAATFVDTLGTTALTVSGVPPSPVNYKYTGPTGAQSIQVLYSTRSVRTAFNCTGSKQVQEYGPTNVSLVDSIIIPGVGTYRIEYEQTTAGVPTPVTGRVSKITLPTGGSVTYTYTGSDGLSRGIFCDSGTPTGLTRVTSPGGTWSYERSNPATTQWITSVTDPEGNETEYSFQYVATIGNMYETQRLVKQVTGDATTLLETVETCYNAATIPCTSTVVTLPVTRRTLTTKIPNESGKVSQTVSVYRPDGVITELSEFDYGDGNPGTLLRKTEIVYATLGGYVSNRPATVTIRDGALAVKAQTTYTYDQGNVTQTTGTPQLATPSGPRGNATTITYSISEGASTNRSFTYFDTGLVRTATNPDQQYTYNSSGCPNSLQTNLAMPHDLSRSTAWSCVGGVPTSTIDENGKTTTYSYDAQWRPTSILRPDGSWLTITRESDLSVTTSFPIEGTDCVKKRTYPDGFGRALRQLTTSCAGSVVSRIDVQFDSLGREKKVSNPYEGESPEYWTEVNYDPLNRLTRVTAPDGLNATTYEYVANTVTVTDPTNKQQKRLFDAAGRLKTVYEPDVNGSNSLTIETVYTYSPLNKLLTVIQGAQTRTFVYDRLGRLMTSMTPEAGTVAYEYNNFDQVTRRTDARGVTTNYVYDLGRLSQIWYDVSGTTVPATAAVNYTYGTDPAANNKGRVIGMSDGTGSEAYLYDIGGRIRELTKTINGTPNRIYTTKYEYNLSGDLKRLTYPSGLVLNHIYDAVGRLNSLSEGPSDATTKTYISNMSYNPAGRVQSYSLGIAAGVISTNFVYSPDMLQLNSLTYSRNNSAILEFLYGYTQNDGNNGQITSIETKSIVDALPAVRNATYSYDALYRLQGFSTTGSETFPALSMSWTYDRYGNRTRQTTNGEPQDLSPAPLTNRLSGYDYDGGGNILSDVPYLLTWDAESRLVQYGQDVSYKYDGNGLRVRRKLGTDDTERVYVFSGTKVIAEYVYGAEAFTPSVEYVYLADRLVASKQTTDNRKFYLHDHLSVRGVVDDNTGELQEQGHKPFGERWYGDATKWRFTTYERDSASLLPSDYAMARYHCNWLGRYSSPDVLHGNAENPQSWNRYSYVRNDPINLVDPSGMGCWYLEWGWETDYDGAGGGLRVVLGRIQLGCQSNGARLGGSVGTPTYGVDLDVINDCLQQMNIPVKIVAMKPSTPGANGYVIGIGRDFFSRGGSTVPIVVTNDASTYNAAQIGPMGGRSWAYGFTDPRTPYNNFTNNNNNAFGTLITQLHELAHSLFTITTGSALVQEPAEQGFELENCVRGNHGIARTKP